MSIRVIREHIPKFEHNMALLEGDSARIIDEFNGENFNIWRFKLASMDLWALLTNLRQFHLPTLISKWRRITKDVWRRQCPSFRSAWWTINLCTIGVLKSQWRHGKPFVISTIWGTWPIFSSFTASSSHGRRWWFVGLHQQNQGICGSSSLFGGIHEKWRCSNDFAQEFMMPQWCYVKAKWTIHLCKKILRYATIVANWATLHVFATRQRTTIKRMQTTLKMMMTMHSQRNMEHIQRRL